MKIKEIIDVNLLGFGIIEKQSIPSTPTTNVGDEIKNAVTEAFASMPINTQSLEVSEPETSLTESEVSEILDYLLKLQEELFPELALSENLSKNFVWNIPRSLYDNFKESLSYDDPIALNPITMLYLLLVDDAAYSSGYFITKLMENASTNREKVDDALCVFLDDDSNSRG